MADEEKKSQVKRYYWLKMPEDFFASKRIKRLRMMAGGDTYTIIYLKLQLKALKEDGYLYFDNVMGDFVEELALDIDEKPDDVKVTVNYLLSVGLMESSDNGDSLSLPYLRELIGSESVSAQRMRKLRETRKGISAPKNNNVISDGNNVTQSDNNVTESDDIYNYNNNYSYIYNNNQNHNQNQSDNQNNNSVKIEVVDETESWFNSFWKEYPKKQKKPDALKAFKKKCKSESDFKTIMEGLHRWNQSWDDMQFIPYPASWLNGEQYNDEPIKRKNKGGFQFSNL